MVEAGAPAHLGRYAQNDPALAAKHPFQEAEWRLAAGCWLLAAGCWLQLVRPPERRENEGEHLGRYALKAGEEGETTPR